MAGGWREGNRADGGEVRDCMGAGFGVYTGEKETNMKSFHFWMGLLSAAACACAGAALLCWNWTEDYVREAARWCAEAPSWGWILAGAVLLVWLALFLATGLPRKRKQYVTFDNENGRVSVDLEAVQKYLNGLKGEFAALSWLKSALRVRKGALQVGLVVGVKSGTQIPELCKMIQKRVQEILQEHLGTCDLEGVGVEVHEIRSRGAGNAEFGE